MIAIWIRHATARLAAAGIDRPSQEARLLLAHATGLDTAAQLRHRNEPVPPEADRALARRAAHEPLAYITGRRDFWTLTLAVSPATLIPRPDSETLIEAALAACPDTAAVQTILDLGTGTGCLVLAALTVFPDAWGVGVDISPAAAAVARTNAEALDLGRRCAIMCADWAAPLAHRFDLVLANPPYIPTADLAGLMPDVGNHEPWLALDGGADGLRATAALVATLPRLLGRNGCAIIELGAGQAVSVGAMARSVGLVGHTRRDLGGHPRALILRFDEADHAL